MTEIIEDGAYFCYCAYILRISRCAGFYWMVPTNRGIFLHGLKLCRGSRNYQVLLVSKKEKFGVTMHFSETIKLQFGKKCHALLCILLFSEQLLLNYLLKMRGYLQFSFWVSVAVAKICFPRRVISHTKILI